MSSGQLSGQHLIIQGGSSRDADDDDSITSGIDILPGSSMSIIIIIIDNKLWDGTQSTPVCVDGLVCVGVRVPMAYIFVGNHCG